MFVISDISVSYFTNVRFRSIGLQPPELRGKEFASPYDYRRAVWGEVGKVEKVADQFKSNKKSLSKAYSSFVPESEGEHVMSYIMLFWLKMW